jgi:hypothetical protein
MKTNSIFFLLTMVFISSLIQCQTKTEEEQITDMLRTFYIDYITEISRAASDNVLDSLKQIYCTPALLERIQNELNNRNIDYDPLIYAQDASTDWLKTLTIKKDTVSLGYYNISYKDQYDGITTKIKLRVIKQNDSFMIDDIW